MSNAGLSAARVAKIQKNPSLHLTPVRDGWNSIVFGLPFDPDYGRSAPQFQTNYERGRLAALEAKAVGVLRPWTGPLTYSSFMSRIQPFTQIVAREIPRQPRAA